MSTVERKSQRAGRAKAAAPPPAPTRSIRRWFILGGLGVLLLLVAFAPAILLSTPLRDQAITWCLRDVHGSVSCESISAGWLSPVVLSEIVVCDARGQTVIHVPTMTGEKTLLGMIGSGGDLGKFQLDRPEIDLVLRDQGSNLEEIFAAWLKVEHVADRVEQAGKPDNSPAVANAPAAISLDLEIVAATVQIEDESSRQQCRLEQLGVKLHVPRAGEALEAEMVGTVRQGEVSGPLEVKLSATPLDAPQPGLSSAGQLSLRAGFVPLSIGQAILCRSLPGSQLSGTLQANLGCQWGLDAQGAGHRLVNGQANVRGLGVGGSWLGGDVIQLQQLDAPCQLTWEGGRWQLKQLAVSCDVGQFSCQGTLAPPANLGEPGTAVDYVSALRGAAIDASGQLDLARLARMLPNYFQLRPDVKLTAGQLGWQLQGRTAGGVTTWRANVQASRLAADCQGREVSCERPLAVSLAARQDDHGTTIENVHGEADFLNLQGAGTPDNFQLSATCDLSRLASEAGKFVDLTAFQLAGLTQLRVAATASADQWNITTLDATAQSLVVRGAGCNIEESGLRLSGTGRYWRNRGLVEFPQLALRSATLSADLTAAKIDLGRPGTSASGQMVFAGDLGRLQGWFAGSGQARGYQWAGRLGGQVSVQPTQQGMAVDAVATVENLVVTPASGKAWNESLVKVTAQAAYDERADTLALPRVELNSNLLRCQVSGQVAQLSTRRQLDSRGQFSYDLEQITALLGAELGDKVRLAGRETHAFEFHGPLAAPAVADRPSTAGDSPAPASGQFAQLSGKADLGWQSADLFGFQFGPSKLQTELAAGVVRIVPCELSVNGGRLRLAGQMQLAPGMVVLEPGPVLEQVEVTRDVCNRGLMFIAPVLGNVADVRGKFSVALAGGQIPLANPAAGDVSGTLTIHSIEVDTGPLVQELSVLMSRPTTARIQQQSQVAFRLVQGRIYHQGLELVFPEFTLRTSGSVGLDQSLALTAELPMPPKWLANIPGADRLKSQAIKVPIGGTVSQPKIDPHVLENLMKQFVGQAIEGGVGGALRSGLNKQLDRLLGQ